MLAQFQSLYPNGNLIAELVQIFQGKYIVRASVQIEGVTRATGMAAAETIEVAEDQARNRALMVLGITSAPEASVAFSPKSTSQAQQNLPLSATVGLNQSNPSSTSNGDFGSGQWSVSSSQETPVSSSEQQIKLDPITNDTRNLEKSDTYSQNLSQSFPVASDEEIELDRPEDLEMMSDYQSENPLFSGNSASNVTPLFTPRNYGSQENVSTLTGAAKKKKKSEPVNLSDILAKTDVQIERLNWTKDQGKEHLKKTYGKLGRSLLSEEELLDFLRYLESQPDPVAGF